MQPKLWNVNALSVELGKDRRALNRMLEGLEPDKVEKKGRGESRLYLMRRVVEHMLGQLDPDVGEGDVLPARTEKDLYDRARRKRVEFDHAVARSEYIRTEDAIQLYAGMCAEAKGKLRGIPAKLAPRLVGEEAPAVIQTKIAAEIDEALDSLAEP